MTRIRINDEVYDLKETVSGAALGDLIVLKLKSKGATGFGVSVKTLNDMFGKFRRLQLEHAEQVLAWEEAGSDPDSEPASAAYELLDDETILVNLIGLVFLAKRKAGLPFTWEQASGIAFNELAFSDDDAEDDDEQPDGPGKKDDSAQ